MEQLTMKDMVIEQMIVTSALRDRIVYLNEDTNRESMFKCAYLLDRIVSLDKQKHGYDENNLEPIEIRICSEGGVIYFGTMLLSKIMELKDMGYKIITRTDGMAMSMGAMIFVLGDERIIGRYATFMIHSPSAGTWGTLQDIADDVDETNRLWQLMKKIVIENTDVTDEQLEDLRYRKKDWYLGCDECIKHKIATKIV